MGDAIKEALAARYSLLPGSSGPEGTGPRAWQRNIAVHRLIGTDLLKVLFLRTSVLIIHPHDNGGTEPIFPTDPS